MCKYIVLRMAGVNVTYYLLYVESSAPGKNATQYLSTATSARHSVDQRPTRRTRIHTSKYSTCKQGIPLKRFQGRGFKGKLKF